MKSNKKWPCIGRVIRANLNGTVNVAIPGWNMGNGPEETALFYSEWTTDPTTTKAWQDIIATGNSLAFVMSPLNGGAGPSYYGTSGGGYSADPNSDYRSTISEEYPNYAPVDRNDLIKQLDEDPSLKDMLFARTLIEVEDQGILAGKNFPTEQAFMETVFNRALARKLNLRTALTDGFWEKSIQNGYPSLRTLGSKKRDILESILDKVAAGSNITNFATGNASKYVGFGRGSATKQSDGRIVAPNQTFESGKERFGIEAQDEAWAAAQKAAAGGNSPSSGKTYADKVAENIEATRNPRPTYDNTQTETERYFSDLAKNKNYCSQGNCGRAIGEKFFRNPENVYEYGKIYDAKFDSSSDTGASSSYNEAQLKQLLDGKNQFIMFKRTLPSSSDHGVFKTGRVISSGTLPNGKPWAKIKAVGAYQGSDKKLYTSQDRVLTTDRGHGGETVPGLGKVYTLERVHDFTGLKPDGSNIPNTFDSKSPPPIAVTDPHFNSSGPTPMSPDFAAHVEHFPAANGSFSLPSLGSYVILNLLDGMTIPIVMGYFMGAAESTNVLGSFPVNETDGTPEGVAAESNQLANENLFTHKNWSISPDNEFKWGIAPDTNEKNSNDIPTPLRNNGNHVLYNTPKGFLSFSGITGEEKMILKGALQNILRLDNDGWQQYAQNYFSRVPGLANSLFGTIYENIKNSKNTNNEGYSTNESSNRITHIAQQTVLDIFAQAHQIASTFDIDRLNGQHPDCPVCKGSYQRESLFSSGGIVSAPPQVSSVGNTKSGAITKVPNYHYEKTKPDTPECFTCRGSGRSPSTEGGRYPNMVSQKQNDMKKIYEDNREILKQMRDTIHNSGGNGNYLHAGNTHIGAGLASYDFDFPSCRIDEKGRLSVVSLISGRDGLDPHAVAVPLVEPVEVPDPGFGNVNIVGNRSISIKSGSGGIDLSTTGNVNQTGGIYKADYVSASFSGKKGIMVDGGSGGTIIRGNSIKLSPSDNGEIGGKHVMIDGHASVNDNLFVAGGAAINGNLSVPSMTMPGKVAMTEYEYDSTNPKEANPTKGVINGTVQSPLTTGFIKIYNSPQAAAAGTPTGAPLVIMEGAEYYFRIEQAIMKIEPTGGETEGDYPVVMQPHAHPMIVPNIDIVKGPRKVPVLMADGTYKETELSPTQAVYAAGMVDSNNGRLVAYSTPSSLLPYSMHQETSGDKNLDTTGGPVNIAV